MNIRKITLILLTLTMGTWAETKKPLDPDKVRKLLSPYMKMQVRDEGVLEKNKDLINLGRVLFYDKRLSGEQNISCNSCHDLKNYGTNGEYFKKQLEEKTFYRDVPSVYNKAGFEIFNWDGSHKTLASQTAAAISSKHEMNMPDKDALVSRLAQVKGYEELFAKAFAGDKKIDHERLVKALTAFQSGLISLAPIDDFLKGNNDALTEKQLEGAMTFDEKSCFACHTGANFGGQMLIKLGVTDKWPNQKDLGMYHLTKNSKHKMIFRVAPLRNIAKTAPYFHDASSRRLWDAIQKMSWYELGQDISFGDVMKITHFMKSLTGDIPHEYIKEPAIPE